MWFIDSYETCEESKGRGLQQLVKRNNFSPGVEADCSHYLKTLELSEGFRGLCPPQNNCFFKNPNPRRVPQMQSLKKRRRWRTTFRTKRRWLWGGHRAPLAYPRASMLGTASTGIVAAAISGGHLHQNHAEDQGEGWGPWHEINETVVFFHMFSPVIFCDTLIDSSKKAGIYRDPVFWYLLMCDL